MGFAAVCRAFGGLISMRKRKSEGGDNVLHVGATGQSYPFAYKENGKLTGFDVDVMEAVAKNQHETGLEAA